MSNATPEQSAETAVKGFFGSLFDFQFKNFVSRRLAGIFYAVGLIIIGLSAVIALITGIVGGFASMANPYLFGSGAVVGGVLSIIATIVIVPVATLVAVIILRVWIEAVVALVAVAENTASLRK